MPITNRPADNYIDDLTAPAPAGGGVGGGSAWFGQLYAWLKQFSGALAEAAVTLASDTFTPLQAAYILTPESGSSDNLARIAAGYDGMVLRIRPAISKTITVKNAQGGAGQILIADNADLVLSDPTMRLVLSYSVSATAWTEEDRIYGANKTGFTAWLNAATSSLAGIIKAATIAITRTGAATDTAVTPDALASLWQKGSDIASATTLVKPSDSNLGGYHVITGTTPVTTMWAGTTAGEEYEFEAAGALPLVNGSNLVLFTGANITWAAGDRFRLRYFGSSVWKMVGYSKFDGTPLVAPVSFIPRGWLSPDFAFENDAVTPNTKIKYRAGQMTDGANVQAIEIAAGTIDLTTNGADGLDTGSLANSTGYWLFAITNGTLKKAIASLSMTSPSMPGGYTVKRRCGAFWTDASAHVVPWIVAGPGLYMVDSPNTVTPLVSGTGAQTGTAPLPTGKKWQLLTRVGVFLASSGTTIAAGVYDPDGTAQTPSIGRADAFSVGGTSNEGASSSKEVTTDTSSQFKATGINGATVTVTLIGWREDGLN